VEEFTVFIKVKILSLKAGSKLIYEIVSNEHKSVNDSKKIITDKKYLFISDVSIEFSEKVILLI
tara:strand:+ start:139 stop:330 length:192 start_codon:yes stop_codon:yes gene_type:complete